MSDERNPGTREAQDVGDERRAHEWFDRWQVGEVDGANLVGPLLRLLADVRTDERLRRNDATASQWSPAIGQRVRCVDDSEGTVIRIDAMVRWDDGKIETHESVKLRPCRSEAHPKATTHDDPRKVALDAIQWLRPYEPGPANALAERMRRSEGRPAARSADAPSPVGSPETGTTLDRDRSKAPASQSPEDLYDLAREIVERFTDRCGLFGGKLDAVASINLTRAIAFALRDAAERGRPDAHPEKAWTSTHHLTPEEIAIARGEGKLVVDANGMGSVPTEWFEQMRRRA